MKVKIPKDLVGASYPTVMTIEFNDFNTDMFLAALFLKIMSDGRSRLKGKNKETDIGMYVEKLANHPLLTGFQTLDGRRILEKFVRTSLIKTGGVTRANLGEQISALTPFSLLCYKPGFPSEGRRQRGVDTFLYYVLREHLRAEASIVEAQPDLKARIISFFGKGLKFDKTPNSIDAAYDGQADLDTLTRLSLAFIDGFDVVRPGRESESSKASPCPALATHLAHDIFLFLENYADRMPIQALTYYFQALISFEMYNYSLRLATAINTLVRTPAELPGAMRDRPERSEPLIYLDFTGRPKHLSGQMAAECVRRDVETFQQFFRSMLQLRWLDKQVAKFKKSAITKAAVERLLQGHSNGAAYLQSLLQMRDDAQLLYSFAAAAQHDIASIREATLPHAEESAETESDWLDEIMAPAQTDIDQLVLLLEEGQRQNILKNYIGWIVGAGGMSKAHGLLSGISRQRRTWRYAPGNDLLSLLVQLATAHAIPNEQRGTGARPSEIRLQDFLRFLEDRYGIIVDCPPPGIRGAEYSAAARDNLRAMLSRLRQMGIFTDLSDDFTVQRLRPPYGDSMTTGEEQGS